MPIFKLFRKNDWPPVRQNPPWGSAPSIYAHIAAHIDPERATGLAKAGYQLPDDVESASGKITFAPGAMDGILGHHGATKSEDQLAKDIHAALKAATSDGSARNITTLYRHVKSERALSSIDLVLQRILDNGEIDPARLADIAVWFATQAADREPVKFMIAVLGVIPGRDDSELFLTLGRHDEFTLYAAVAITNQTEDSTWNLYRLARSAEGWGRIHTVERLAGATHPEIKDWLIREGYKNDVMEEYLACICARAGELHTALAVDVIDDGLFQSACEIVAALVSGDEGPAEGLSQYEHGCALIQSLLHHGQPRFRTAFHYWFLTSLKDRIDAHHSGARKMQHDWTPAKTEAILTFLAAQLTDPKWPSVISNALEQGDRLEFWRASRISAAVGIDPWPAFYRRTDAGEDYWWDLMAGADGVRIDQILALADRRIPLDEIATGASDSMGLAAEFAAHSALDFILQDLGKFPGKGWHFIKTGLLSPVIRNRHMAIRALTGWGKDNWPDEATNTIEAAITAEPQEDVKVLLQGLL